MTEKKKKKKVGRKPKYGSPQERKAADRDRQRAYYQANKEHIAEIQKAWREANPDKVKEYRKKRKPIPSDPTLRKQRAAAAVDQRSRNREHYRAYMRAFMAKYRKTKKYKDYQKKYYNTKRKKK